MSALGVKDEPAYAHSFRRRQVELVTALINGAEDGLTYQFRLISRPDAEVPARGSVEMYLLCRVEGSSQSGLRHRSDELLRLMSSLFPEYETEAVADEELREILQPFHVTNGFGVRRRVGCEPLDTLGVSSTTDTRSISQAAYRERKVLSPVPVGAVLHINSFLPAGIPFNTLYRLLLLEPVPCAITVTFIPAELNPEEIDVLQHSIGVCERYMQVSLSSVRSDDVSDLFPTLREKARTHQDGLTRLMLGLKDNAAYMSICIFSPGPLSRFIPEALAATITEPSGGTRPDPRVGVASYSAGGYDLISVDPVAANHAIATLGLVTPPISSIPEGAHRLPYLFDSAEASAALLLPPITSEPLPGVRIRGWKPAAAPNNLPPAGVLLGRTVELRGTREVRISPDDRLRHLYAVGQTGTGKSTLLRTMILDDIRSGRGVCVLDPHGDIFNDISERIPASRRADVIRIDPTDPNFDVGLNLLEVREESQRHFIILELTGILTRMLRDAYGDHGLTMVGPVFFQHLRLNTLLVMSDPDKPGTLMDIYRVFQELDYWKKWLPLKLGDPILKNWVENTLPNVNYLNPTSEGPPFGAYMSSKFESFLFDPMLREMFSKPRSTFSFREAMDEGKIVLVNLAKGELSEPNATFLGMVVLATLQSAALSRSRVPQGDRRPFYVYVDEFQNVATENFATLLSEGRKFGLGITLANQFLSQIENRKIMNSIFGNVGTLVFFRVGDSDAERLEKEVAPTLSRSDLLDLPNWHAYVSTLINNQAVRPFEMCTIPSVESSTQGSAT